MGLLSYFIRDNNVYKIIPSKQSLVQMVATNQQNLPIASISLDAFTAAGPLPSPGVHTGDRAGGPVLLLPLPHFLYNFLWNKGLDGHYT